MGQCIVQVAAAASWLMGRVRAVEVTVVWAAVGALVVDRLGGGEDDLATGRLVVPDRLQH